jgi:hypothetical protein
MSAATACDSVCEEPSDPAFGGREGHVPTTQEARLVDAKKFDAFRRF